MNRALVGFLLAAQLLALAPTAQAAEEDLGIGALQTAFYGQLAQQGLLPREVSMAAQLPPPRPPGLMFRDAHAVCDLDADGVEDVVSNDLVINPPSLRDSDARLVAISGADGSELWKADNLAYGAIQSPPNGRLDRSGGAQPGHPDNAQAVADVDGDGVCDVFAYGMDDGDTQVGEPLFNSASV